MEAVRHASKLYIGHVLEPKHFTFRCCTDDYVLKLLFIGKAAFIAHHVLKTLVAVLAELTGRGLNVLLGKCCGNVGRHQPILCHHVRLKPYSHTVVSTHHHGISDTRYSFQHRDNVDSHIVLYEFLGIIVVFRIDVEHHKHR